MKIVKATLLIVWIMTGCYLLMPSPRFPNIPPGSIQSSEPGDTESIYRKAYYTNLTRPEIMDFYFTEFGKWGIVSNHPPEEAQVLVRDQTKSSFLEEIVHPGRESIYVNGYFPTLPKDAILINDKSYLNKVTVRYVPSTPIPRLTVLTLTLLVTYLLIKEYGQFKR